MTSPWRQAGTYSTVAAPGAVQAYEEQVLWDKNEAMYSIRRYLPENVTHSAKLI